MNPETRPAKTRNGDGPMTRPIRVLLADPPLGQERYVYYHPTMGILYLIGALRREFAPESIIVKYLKGHTDLAGHLRAVSDFEPDFYGLSFKTPVARNGYATLAAVKQRFPNLLVAAGGAHPSLMPGDVLTETRCDLCFVGECEHSFPLAIRGLQQGSLDLASIPGVYYLENGRIAATQLLPFAQNLDDLPRPAWDMAELDMFSGMPYRKSHPYAGITVSRGCPYQCTFCSEPIWKIHGKPSFRARSPEDVAHEVGYLYGRGVRELRLWTEELNADIAWAEDLLNIIADLNLHDLKLSANIRGDKVPMSLANSMARANMWIVNMGIESASNRTLAGIGKQVAIEEIERSCQTLTQAGIKVHGYFQFYLAWQEGESLCWEDRNDATRTLQWAARMHMRGHLQYMGTTISTPRPGTPLWALAERFDLLKSNHSRPFYYLEEGMNLPGVSSAEVRSTMMMAYALKLYMGLRSQNFNAALLPRYAQRVWRQLAST